MIQLKRKLLIPLAIFLGIVLALYATIYFVCKHYLNDAEIRKFVNSRANAVIHRDVTVGDKIKFNVSWNFTPHVEISDVTIANFAGSKQPLMVNIKNLQLSIDLIQLLYNNIRITKLTLTDAVVNLETLNGVDNWNFDEEPNKESSKTVDSKVESSKSSSRHITADSIVIINSHITYTKDHQLEQSLDVKSLKVKANDANTYFDGTLDAMHKSARLVFDGDVTMSDDEYKFDFDKFEYGKTDLRGTVKIDRKSKAIKGELKSRLVDLTPAVGIGNTSATNSSSSGEYSIPTTTIPVDFLRDSNVNVVYAIQKFIYKDVILQNVKLKANSKNNIIDITFDPKLKIANGNLDIDLKYNLNSKTPTMNVIFVANGINFATLLTQLSGSSPLTGSTLDINSNLQSAGSTFAALVNNLSGKILITASAGQYVNSSTSIPGLVANVLSGVITFKKTENSTTFTCGVMNFQVNNGQAIANRGIAIEAASVNVLGNGSIDLRNGKINFSMVPKNINLTSTMDLSQFSMAQAVSVSGTISKPVVSLNPINLLSPSNIVSAASLASKIAVWPLGVASVAKDVVAPGAATTQQASPCAIALGN